MILSLSGLLCNAEIQIALIIAGRRSSRTNGRLTVTTHIDPMLALCVQMMI
jgi:hypothetical protein